jgi:4-hydroxy-tetrahydrodipicolinate reductase
MTKTTTIIVNGARGKMGREVVKAIEQHAGLTLAAALDHGDDLAETIRQTKANVVVDFTTPAAVFNNTQTIIEQHCHPVIGTTGLSQEQIKTLQQLATSKQLGGIIAPNFSLAAVMMMQMAAMAARYFSAVEIIELHHDQKKDAPSGTALKTAEMIAHQRQGETQSRASSTHASNSHARGATYADLQLHSVRLPGLLAHQEVIFGSQGETLTLRCDSISREAYIPGVIMACLAVSKLDRLVYGLEHLL